MKLKDIIFTFVFAALWIGLIYKKESLYNWIYQFENIYVSYLMIAIPIIIYAAIIIITRVAKSTYLKKG
jgi:predicted branched-subunit amino acid permease